MTINTFFIIYKGAKGLGLDNTPLDMAFGVAFGIGVKIPVSDYIKLYIEYDAQGGFTEIFKEDEKKSPKITI